MAPEVRTVEQRTPNTRDGGQPAPPRPVFLAPADIYETSENIVVLAEMPGVSSEGVDITLERRVLTIRGRGAAHAHTDTSASITNSPTAITSTFSLFRKTSIASGSRRR